MADSAVLVETTILVDYLRGSRTAADYLDAARSEGELFSSAVTKAELIVGSRTRANAHSNRHPQRQTLQAVTGSESRAAVLTGGPRGSHIFEILAQGSASTGTSFLTPGS